MTFWTVIHFAETISHFRSVTLCTRVPACELLGRSPKPLPIVLGRAKSLPFRYHCTARRVPHSRKIDIPSLSLRAALHGACGGVSFPVACYLCKQWKIYTFTHTHRPNARRWCYWRAFICSDWINHAEISVVTTHGAGAYLALTQ